MTSGRIAVVLAAALVACAGSRADRRSDTTAAPAQNARAAPPRGMGDVCPMSVPDTKVSSADTAQGAALTFTTSDPGRVDDLRRRVRAMADMHDEHMAGAGGARSGTGTQADQGADQPGQGMQGRHAGHGVMPASRATVEDVVGGARVDIEPVDPAQAEQVRSMARMHAQRMQSQGCGMMHGG